ncbi:MAG: ParB N-terminal domain-containing protein [Armatimonadetes bacterium]|nr:ParB N-terminal domain-containing protein [Armatimonadota bacterium]
MIAELSASIAERSLLQPILVLRNPADDGYDIIAGNARYEACQQLRWNTIPAIVCEPSGVEK